MYSIHIEQGQMIISFVTSDIDLAMQVAQSLDAMRPYINTWIRIENNDTGEREYIKYTPVNPLP